ncbi:MAG: tRNA (adenine-N1)-methyltransferase [Anaerolineales bacterium]|nr:tRNA (adenine-N1)-methyltransferase [Anaerolineales bacterium]
MTEITMSAELSSTCPQYGDLVQLVSPTNKRHIFRLTPGAQLQTHRGVIQHDDLTSCAWGSEVLSHQGSSYFLLQPALIDLLLETKRSTQIMYPKDIGYILIKLNVAPGQRILEAGTGSGAFTTALAWSVGAQGKITSYEVRAEMQNLARKNLARVELEDRVTFKIKDIATGFDETHADAVFLDLPNPHDYLRQTRAALKPGGYFGCILPTTNQVTILLDGLYKESYAFVEVCEIMLRYYKPVSERLRPTDRMVAHTGYLIFARPVNLLHPPGAPSDSTPPVEDEERDEGSPG